MRSSLSLSSSRHADQGSPNPSRRNGSHTQSRQEPHTWQPTGMPGPRNDPLRGVSPPSSVRHPAPLRVDAPWGSAAGNPAPWPAHPAYPEWAPHLEPAVQEFLDTWLPSLADLADIFNTPFPPSHYTHPPTMSPEQHSPRGTPSDDGHIQFDDDSDDESEISTVSGDPSSVCPGSPQSWSEASAGQWSGPVSPDSTAPSSPVSVSASGSMGSRASWLADFLEQKTQRAKVKAQHPPTSAPLAARSPAPPPMTAAARNYVHAPAASSRGQERQAPPQATGSRPVHPTLAPLMSGSSLPPEASLPIPMAPPRKAWVLPPWAMENVKWKAAGCLTPPPWWVPPGAGTQAGAAQEPPLEPATR